MPPQLQRFSLSPPPTTMTTNHQNHNQITNPNPQPNHHSPPTARKRKRKRKTIHQNHKPKPTTSSPPTIGKGKRKTTTKREQKHINAITYGLIHTCEWSSEWIGLVGVEWGGQPLATTIPMTTTPIKDPRWTLSRWPIRSSLNLDAHASQRPTNLDPQNQVTPLSSSTSISAATLRRRSGFRVQWCLGFEVPSQWTLEGRSSNHEIERNRSYRKERRGKWERREKIEEKNKIFKKKKEKKWPLGIKKNNIWFNIYGTVSCYWWQLTVAVCQNFWHLKSLM